MPLFFLVSEENDNKDTFVTGMQARATQPMAPGCLAE